MATRKEKIEIMYMWWLCSCLCNLHDFPVNEHTDSWIERSYDYMQQVLFETKEKDYIMEYDWLEKNGDDEDEFLNFILKMGS